MRQESSIEQWVKVALRVEFKVKNSSGWGLLKSDLLWVKVGIEGAGDKSWILKEGFTREEDSNRDTASWIFEALEIQRLEPCYSSSLDWG